MRLRLEQLPAHLERGLAPVYLIAGDEPLQLGEAADAVRRAARARGCSEREVLHVEAGFDWNRLLADANSLSLFAEQRLIDLRLPSAKPGDSGTAALLRYCERPPADLTLLVTCGKLDGKTQNTRWVKALDAAGVYIPIWPVEPARLPAWVQARMRARGLEATTGAARLLAERVEGNLLAAAQEVDKLVMLLGSGRVDEETVRRAVVDSARYDIFELMDTALAGDAVRTARVIAGLRAEDAEPVLVLWAVARDVRDLALMAAEVERGARPEQVVEAHRVWDKRKPPILSALRRHRAGRWQAMLATCLRVDRMVKGSEQGNVWDELLGLVLWVAGVRV